MSIRSSARNLFLPLDNPELTIRRRPRVDPTLLKDFEMATNGNSDDVPPPGGGDLPVPDLRTTEELFQPTLNGRGGPIASIVIQATNFELKNVMIQQVQNSCQFYGLPSDDTNKHLDNFLYVTQSIKVNGVTDDALRLSESSSFITSSSDPEIVALKAKIAKINKNLIKVLQINQQVKAVTHNCETCGGTHSYNDCPATAGQTQKVYAAGAYNQGGASHGQNPPPAYQALIPQPQVVTTTEFINYIKANDSILKNMQKNMTSLTNSNLELKNMFGQFMKMNIASSSGSGTLPSNTITNPKEDLKGITTRSGIAYKGPTIPTTSAPYKVVERETNVTKDTVPLTNNRSTKDVQPLVVQFETQIPNSKPIVALVVEPVEALVSAQKPNPKLTIPYPFADALILMPKFGPTIKILLTNKEKLLELARTPLKEHCSAVLLKKLPKKLGDHGKFLILCDFPGMDECLALANLGTSVNLMPLSMWNKILLPELSPTCMTLELTDISISRLVRVTEYVFIKVGTFHFSADFVVVDFDADPQVLLVLERSFLKTGRALIDVYAGELTLRVGNKAVTFNLDQTSIYTANYDAMSVKRIDVINIACEEYSQEVLGFFLNEGEILLLEEFLNDDPSSPPLPPQELKFMEPNNENSSIDEPPVVKLKDLPPHLEYTFLEGTFQRCMMAIFNDMIEKTMEVFMDDFSIFGNSFRTCLSHLDMMLKHCEDTNLCLNWEKSHFIVKESLSSAIRFQRTGLRFMVLGVCWEVMEGRGEVVRRWWSGAETGRSGVARLGGNSGQNESLYLNFEIIAQ
nr:hypothetical protein [Tanacetum cinerariifolium]